MAAAAAAAAELLPDGFGMNHGKQKTAPLTTNKLLGEEPLQAEYGMKDAKSEISSLVKSE